MLQEPENHDSQQNRGETKDLRRTTTSKMPFSTDSTQVVTHESRGAWSAAEGNPLNAVVRLIVDSFLQNTLYSLQDHLLKQALSLKKPVCFCKNRFRE
jgi:hypothetical protein